MCKFISILVLKRLEKTLEFFHICDLKRARIELGYIIRYNFKIQGSKKSAYD